MTSHIEQFTDFMRDNGCDPEELIIDDGILHAHIRDRQDKPGKKDLWYILYGDDVPAGKFGHWARIPDGINWQSKTESTLTPEQREQNRQRRLQIQAVKDQAKAEVHAACIVKAKKMLAAAHDPDPKHPYIVSHGITPRGAKQLKNLLLIPLYKSKVLTGLQIISETGKKFMTGSEVAGAYQVIKGKGKTVYLAEGWANACKLHDLTGATCITCFDCGNLLETGKAILAAGGNDYEMVFVADNDRLKVGNPGVTKATAAALATGAKLATPNFPGDDGTDVCDLASISGEQAVLDCIQAATKVEAIPAPAPDAENSRIAGIALAGDEWKEPQAIESDIERQEYPLDALPETIRLAVEEVLSFVKAPAPLVVSAALSALSMAVQSHADVARAEKLTGPASTYLLTIADSGERKSTCDNFFTSAIRDYEAKQAEAAKPFIKEYEAAFSSWDMKNSGVKDSIRAAAKAAQPTEALEADLLQLQMDKPEPPRIPRIIYGDATPAALKYSLAKGWPSGAVVSSEGGIVFGGHGMKKDSAMENLATLNQLWDGTDMPTERRATESYTVKGARFTMSIMVQEATLRAFFRQDGGLARGTGFLARFLIAWPESTQGFRPFTEAPENWPSLASFNHRISTILNQDPPIDDDGALHPEMMTLTPGAKEAWIGFHDAIESLLATGGELFDIRDVASKTADNAARLACQFHVFSGDAGAISLNAFESASRITAWHLNEARRFFGGLALPQELADAARLDCWMLAYCKRHKTNTIPIAAIQQGAPIDLRKKVAIESAVQELESLERARLVIDGKRKTIHINPALIGGKK